MNNSCSRVEEALAGLKGIVKAIQLSPVQKEEAMGLEREEIGRAHV